MACIENVTDVIGKLKFQTIERCLHCGAEHIFIWGPEFSEEITPDIFVFKDAPEISATAKFLRNLRA